MLWDRAAGSRPLQCAERRLHRAGQRPWQAAYDAARRRFALTILAPANELGHEPEINLKRCGSAFLIAYANGFFDLRDENLPVADSPGRGVLDDCINDLIH